ncbi:hypothetical protein ABPG75_012511 [Micractinium tetrahymenae]
MADAPAPQPAPQRKRLALKPRDPEAAARLEAERQAHLASKNPFGDAKPREVVIAQKVGKTEEEVLKEEVSKEKLHLRLSGAQLEEKRQAEAEIEETKEALGLEDDEGKRAALQAQLSERQKKLDDLMETFAKVTLETALSGGAPRVSQIRQQQQLAQEQGAPGAAPGGYGQGRGGYGQGQQYSGGGSFGGREFTEVAGRGGGGGGGSRGFPKYQDRGGFSDSYQQPERQGSGRRGGGPRLPEWALDDAADAGFYDAPAATSAFIASGGFQGGGGGPQQGGGGYSGGGRGGRGGRNNRGGGGGGGGSGGYSRGLGGEFQFSEGDSSFGAGQDRF